MGSIVDKLSKLIDTKTAIKEAITAKGVTVEDSDPFSSYAEKILLVNGGSGGASGLVDGTITGYAGNELEIRNSAFTMCTNLLTVDFPNVETIGMNAFSGCAVLASVNFPSVQTIGTQAFYLCLNLSSVELPRARSIQMYAFRSSNLKSLILSGENVCTLENKDAFSGTPISSGTGYIYVPARLQNDYMYGTNWSSFGDRIRAIEDYPEITGGAT